jgi:hypothetical protein
MWCPLCSAEYRADFSRCRHCGVALVNAQPKIPPGVLRDRLFRERAYKGCWYYGAPVAAFDAAQEAVRTCGLETRLVDSSRLVIAARRPSRLQRLVDGDVEIAVAITEPADGRCLVQVWAQAIRRSASWYRPDASSSELWADVFHTRLLHALYE